MITIYVIYTRTSYTVSVEGWWEKLETSTRPAAMKLKNRMNDNEMPALCGFLDAKKVRQREFPFFESLPKGI